MNRFKLNYIYVACLLMSSATFKMTPSYSEELSSEVSVAPPEESLAEEKPIVQNESPNIREQFQSDYNLMQNLLIKLEGTAKNRNSAKEVQIGRSKERPELSNELSEDEMWLNDEIGVKKAALLKPEESSSIQESEKTSSELIQEHIKKGKRLRVRTR